MKQLLLKEWREHFKFAALGLLGFTFVLLALVRSCTNQLQAMISENSGMVLNDRLQPLLCIDVLVISGLICAVFGAVLGGLQVFAERHPDRRAFLLHRPVGLDTILLGKVLGGAGLYAFGTGLPLLGAVIYVMIPGDVAAPFEWEMVLPVIMIFLLGFVFYGAGLLVGLRSARWYGSRMFGWGPPILAALGLIVVPEFRHALGIILLAGIIIAVAVRASFQTGGFYRDQSPAGKLALSTTCAFAGLLLCALLIALVEDSLRGNSWSYQYTHYQLNRKGEVFQVTDGQPRNPIVRDAEGHVVINPKTGKKISLTDFNQQNPPPLGMEVSVNFTHPPPLQGQNDDRFDRNPRYFVPWRTSGKTFWYLTRHGQLVGYDGETRRKVGELTPAGHSGIGSGAEKGFEWPQPEFSQYGFGAYGNGKREILATENSLYVVNLESQTLSPLFTATNADGIGAYGEEPDEHMLLAAIKDFVIEFNLLDGTATWFPCPPGTADYSSVGVWRLAATNSYALQFDIGKGHDKKNTWMAGDQELFWMTGDGKILKTQNLPKLPEPVYSQGNWDKYENYLLLIFPPGARGVVEGIAYYYGHIHMATKWDAFSFAPAVICVMVAWVMGRRYNFETRDQLAWAVFHLFFGVAGLIAFFSVQEWPAKERCPQCGKLRLVDREHCEYCDAEFAPSEPNGTEIFEAALVGK